ncbi:hypothetical protein NLI96_g4461 [Meripilus lineatus]|uniref:Nicotinamide N-methyltransferase n=1 Tax=Meripilus lineatus TaxID=2056292 RepID=A0AAD5V719_9APHY|nr:hypothetical protein NLI96_g4461 [Physisporinus lineatus]
MGTEIEDVLSDSLQTLYGFTPITHGSAGSSFTYTIPDTLLDKVPHLDSPTVTLITPETQSSNWSLHASSIWVSALFIADHLAELKIEHHAEVARHQGLPLRVLELGAGAGLPGILISMAYREVSVVSSDYPDENLMNTLRLNAKSNGVSDRCSIVPHAWGEDPSGLLTATPLSPQSPSTINSSGFDVIVAADTLWNSSLHESFLNTLASTLRKTSDSRVYLVAGLHTGRYTLQSFIDLVPRFGLRVEELRERLVGGSERRDWDVTRAEGEDEQERRKWVLWISLAWTP